MADKPSDTTPELTKAPPPRRRTSRSETTGSKAKAVRAKPTGQTATKRAVPATTPKTVKDAVKTAKTTATKAVAQAKPKVKAAVKDAGDAAKSAGIGKILAVGAAASISVAAGVAAVIGRKKIVKVGTDAVDAVMGKTEPATPPLPTRSAD